MEELTTQELEEHMSKSKASRIFVNLPLEFGGEFYPEQIFKGLEEFEEKHFPVDKPAGKGLEIIVKYNKFPSHKVMEGANITHKTKAKSASYLVWASHFDLWPYTEIIVSVPKTEENEKLLEQLLKDVYQGAATDMSHVHKMNPFFQ